VIIKRITGAFCLERDKSATGSHYPQSGFLTTIDESLKLHVVHHPNGEMLRLVHAGLVKAILSVLKEARIEEM
jgi:hypothetical protein